MNKKIKLISSFFLLFLILFSNQSFATDEIIEEEISVDEYELQEFVIEAQKYGAKPSYDENELISYVIAQSQSNYGNPIDVSSFNVPWNATDMKILMSYLSFEPELFYFGTSFNFNSKTGSTVYQVIPNYYLTRDEMLSAKVAIEQEKEKYLSGVQDSWNDIEKVLYTYNYISVLDEYNWPAAEAINDDTDEYTYAHRLNGALVEKLPVCDGYSRAFKYFLRQLDIEAEIVSSDEMCHAWNVVKLNNKYYHVDTTWGDNGDYGKINYSYFLLSDSKIQSLSEPHYGYELETAANDTKYDNLNWKHLNHTTNYVTYYNGEWYLVDDKSDISVTWNDLKYVDLYKINFKADVPSKTSYKQVSFPNNDGAGYGVGATSDGNKLYVITNTKIYSLKFDGTGLKVFNTPNLDSGKILYDVEYRDGYIYYDYIQNGAKIACDTPIQIEVIYTTLSNNLLSGNYIMTLLTSSNTIQDIINTTNFPAIDDGYIVKVYSQSNQEKTSTERIGSKNIIKILNGSGNVVKSYTAIVKGDVTGNGQVKAYDALQILKGVMKKTELDEIDTVVRDYDSDGQVKMYDAYQYLRASLLN